ncbi:NtaA/DmoA family FMN-dependent monooxygenase [Rhodococcus sp. NPDC003318]|uniref:NtaA/DmoA family FMN-dependent monooxygenase n=1 Tax=Rhodococcus sp. NPDC003318 TaxID=3364503 RepID=UPI0036944C42
MPVDNPSGDRSRGGPAQRGQRLHFNLFFPFAPDYVWSQQPRADIYYDFDALTHLVRSAERGLFSAVFFGESLRLREHLGVLTTDAITGRPDALVLFAHLAARTDHIGLVATLNTTYFEPYDLARRIATLDVLSGGRAGWNIVTTDSAWTGANFRKGGYLPHSERYTHATEHVDVVQALWDAWPESTPQSPVQAVEWFDTHYRITARPEWPRSPQGQPVFFQAGESDEGRDFAARYAEGIFSRYLDFDAALDYATDLGRRLVKAGRPADDLRIFPATSIVLGDTPSDARERHDWFRGQVWTDRRTRAVVEKVWGRDLSDLDLDGPLPDEPPTIVKQSRSHGVMNSRDRPQHIAQQWRELSRERGFTVRQLVRHLAPGAGFVGTPAAVADRLAEYVHAGAIDGLNLTPTAFPDGLDEIVDRLIPELQDRGIYPTEYAGTTLRENLGLAPNVVRRTDRDRKFAV